MEFPHFGTVRPEWIDFNGHMNVAYYVLALDQATDLLWEVLGLGPAFRARGWHAACSVDARGRMDRTMTEPTRPPDGAAGDPVRVIAVASGKGGVGKSTTARILKELLARWPSSPKVDLVTTDGFLYPNAHLVKNGILNRKGFPESYDIGALLRFLSAIKAGLPNVKAPSYSHLTYDVLPNEHRVIDRPDILIFEGINVLQSRNLPADGKIVPMVSDFFDFSIYIDADENAIHRWYVERFMKLRQTAFRDPNSYFHRYATISEDEAREIAEGLWANINLKNLRENILPTRPRADLILRKGDNHLVETVALRKL